jgi:regulatory protein
LIFGRIGSGDMASLKRAVKNRSSAGILDSAKSYAFLLLKFRLRTEQELAGRMKRKKFPPEAIRQTIDFLKEKKFIDDTIFTRGWLDSRLKRSMGLRRITNELKLKGVKPALIEESIAQVKDSYNEDEVVKDLIRHKAPALKGLEPQKAKQRMYGFLIRRGFSPDVIVDNLNQMIKDES